VTQPKIESVQRRFAKHIGMLKFFTYAQRLDILCAESLELRRLKFDLIEWFIVLFMVLMLLSFLIFFYFWLFCLSVCAAQCTA